MASVSYHDLALRQCDEEKSLLQRRNKELVAELEICKVDKNVNRMVRILQEKVHVPYPNDARDTARTLVAHGISNWTEMVAAGNTLRPGVFKEAMVAWGVDEPHVNRIGEYVVAANRGRFKDFPHMRPRINSPKLTAAQKVANQSHAVNHRDHAPRGTSWQADWNNLHENTPKSALYTHPRDW